eukprot:755833-Hanusia_phi.AAC.1
MQYVAALGGWDGRGCGREVAIFSPDGASSAHMAPSARHMLSPRDALASACLGPELLAIGGHDGANYIASCEVYSASTPGHGRFPQWTWLPSLSASRAFHAATTVRGRVLVFAGQGSRTGTPGGYGEAPVREAMVLSSSEVMDEEMSSWSLGPELPSPRTMVAGASGIDRHFCIGGRGGRFDQSPALDSVLALDVRMKSWMQLPSLSEQRYGAAACSWNQRVYVFGGHDMQKPLSTVEVLMRLRMCVRGEGAARCSTRGRMSGARWNR